MVKKAEVGQKIRGKEVKDVINLSNGQQVVKTEDGKSPRDFRVKIISSQHPQGFTIKHAHFAIDFYGKLCQDKKKTLKLLEAIIKTWRKENIKELIRKYGPKVEDLKGYSLKYILYSLDWILDQEDINFKRRPEKKQKELDKKIERLGFKTPSGRERSQLAIGLFCDIASGLHPVESFYSAGLRI